MQRLQTMDGNSDDFVRNCDKMKHKKAIEKESIRTTKRKNPF